MNIREQYAIRQLFYLHKLKINAYTINKIYVRNWQHAKETQIIFTDHLSQSLHCKSKGQMSQNLAVFPYNTDTTSVHWI